MDFSKKRIALEEAKKMDLVKHLSKSGDEPVKVTDDYHWCLSLLLNWRIPSFKVNSYLNLGYNYGLQKAGNLFAFGITYHQCTIAELIARSSDHLFFQPPVFQEPVNVEKAMIKINIRLDFVITLETFIRYLEHRKIPFELATKYCSEVYYKLVEQTYYTFGFKKIQDVMNCITYIKLSSSLKGTT